MATCASSPLLTSAKLCWLTESVCAGGRERLTRVPYGPPNFISTFYYLTDVDESTPAFAVIPKVGVDGRDRTMFLVV